MRGAGVLGSALLPSGQARASSASGDTGLPRELGAGGVCSWTWGIFLDRFRSLAGCTNYLFLCTAVCHLPVDFQSDSDSFNPTLWEEQRQQRMTVAFEFEEKKEEEENAGKVKVSSI